MQTRCPATAAICFGIGTERSWASRRSFAAAYIKPGIRLVYNPTDSAPRGWCVAPRGRALGALCRASVCFACRRGGELRHKKVTARKMKGPASLQALDLLVAGTGFEPVTFGL